AEQILAAAQSDVAEQRTALAQDVNLLQLLVGAPIDPTLLPVSIEEAAPRIAELPSGLDSRILLRRPDVLEAEYQLRAANAEIGATRAARDHGRGASRPNRPGGGDGGHLPAGPGALPGRHRLLPLQPRCPALALRGAAGAGLDPPPPGDQPRRPLPVAGRRRLAPVA